MSEKTIRNPIALNNVRSYTVYFEDNTAKTIKAVGATNAWFLSGYVWPNGSIVKVEETFEDESIY